MAEPTLPRRPRLKRHVVVAPVGPDQVLLKGPATFVRLAGEGVPLLLDVLPLLDGTRRVEDVVASARHDESDVLEVLEVLHRDAALEDADDDAALDDGAAAKAHPDVMALLSHLLRAPSAAMNRLTRAMVTVVGAGGVADAASRHLAAAGVGDVRHEEPPARRGGWPEAAAVARTLAESDHVLVASDAPDRPMFLAFNDAAREAGTPFTTAFLDGLTGIAGPTVIPGESACWRCYELRHKGTVANLDRLLALEAHLASHPLPPVPLGFPSAAALVGAAAAQAVLTTVSRCARPPLAGHVAVLNPLHLSMARHRVLRLPRCPGCSRVPVPDVDRYDVEPVSLS